MVFLPVSMLANNYEMEILLYELDMNVRYEAT